MAGKLEMDRDSEDERRATGGLSVNQGVSLMLVGVFVSIGLQSIPGLELLPRLALGAVAVIMVILLGTQILRKRNRRRNN